MERPSSTCVGVRGFDEDEEPALIVPGISLQICRDGCQSAAKGLLLTFQFGVQALAGLQRVRQHFIEQGRIPLAPRQEPMPDATRMKWKTPIEQRKDMMRRPRAIDTEEKVNLAAEHSANELSVQIRQRDCCLKAIGDHAWY